MIPWTSVNKVFYPIWQPSNLVNGDIPLNFSTHYFLAVLDLTEKTLDVYDSVYDGEQYDNIVEQLLPYQFLFSHILKLCNFGDLHHTFVHEYKPLVVRWKETPKHKRNKNCGAFVIKYVNMLMKCEDVMTLVPTKMKYYWQYLALSVWGHANWKHKYGYSIPREDSREGWRWLWNQWK